MLDNSTQVSAAADGSNIKQRFQIIRQIGEGSTAKVFKAFDKEDQKQVALKVIEDSIADSMFENEKESLEQLSQCEGVIKMHGSGRGSYDGVESRYIAMEFVEGVELIDFLQSRGALKESVARHIFKQLAHTTKYMHEYGRVHRDIKSDNIMISEGCRVKILDFGFSARIEGNNSNGYFTQKLGTPGYMAPEIKLGQPYKGDEVDTFALGVVLFQMVMGRSPFVEASQSDFLYKCIAANRADIFWRQHMRSMPRGFVLSDEFKDLIIQMLKLMPQTRPTMEQVLNHQWLTQEAQEASTGELQSVYTDRLTRIQQTSSNEC